MDYAKLCESCTKPCKQNACCVIIQCHNYEMSPEWAAEHHRKQKKDKAYAKKQTNVA